MFHFQYNGNHSIQVWIYKLHSHIPLKLLHNSNLYSVPEINQIDHIAVQLVADVHYRPYRRDLLLVNIITYRAPRQPRRLCELLLVVSTLFHQISEVVPENIEPFRFGHLILLSPERPGNPVSRKKIRRSESGL